MIDFFIFIFKAWFYLLAAGVLISLAGYIIFYIPVILQKLMDGLWASVDWIARRYE